MKRRPSMALTVISALALAGTLPSVADVAAAAPSTVAAGGTWGTAHRVSGLAALGAIGSGINSVSCPSAGNCAAGGDYGDGSYLKAFVVNEVNGSWGRALRVPGTNLLSKGRASSVASVSCTSPGNCAAAGTFSISGGYRGFVVSEVNGSWQRALAIPGLAALIGHGSALDVSSVACGAPGNCAAAGNYVRGLVGHGFVVSEVNGSWHKALQIHAIANFDTTEAVSVSCGAASTCVAGGAEFGNVSGPFVITARNGVWQSPLLLRFFGPVTAQIWSVSCRGRNYCAVGGHYFDIRGKDQAFVDNEVNGAWGRPLEVPGSAKLNTGGVAEVLSVSCGARTTCAAVGYYEDRTTKTHPFVVDEVNGAWGTALRILGIPASNITDAVRSISCGTSGNCAAGGYYLDTTGAYQGFVVNEVNGTWGNAVDVPGLRALNVDGHAAVSSISCGAADNCAAGGYYDDKYLAQAFIADEH